MLIAPGLVASLLITPSAVLPATTNSVVVVNVTAASDLPPALVSELLEEAAAIWRPSGVSFIWQRNRRGPQSGVQVLIGGGSIGGLPDRGATLAIEESAPLGWIVFHDKTPAPRIYVSYTKALALLKNSHLNTGDFSGMTIAQRQMYLARAMGRALAHELGHYLLESKRHSEKGLMRARQRATELFGPDRREFGIEGELRDLLADRFASSSLVASR